MAGAVLARAFRGLPWPLVAPILQQFRLALLEDYFEALGLEQTTILPLVFGLPRPLTAERNLTVLALSGVRAEYRTLSEVHPIVTYRLLRAGRFVGSEAERKTAAQFCRPIFGLSMYQENLFQPEFGLEPLLREMTYQDFLSHFETDDPQFGRSLGRWMSAAGKVGNMTLVRELYQHLRDPDVQSDHQVFSRQLTQMASQAPEEYTQFLLENLLLNLQAYIGQNLLLIERALIEAPYLDLDLQFDLGYHQRLDLIRRYRNKLFPDLVLFGLLYGGYQGPLLEELAADVQEPTNFLNEYIYPLLGRPPRARDLPENWRSLWRKFPPIIFQLVLLAAFVGRVDVVELAFDDPLVIAAFDDDETDGIHEFLQMSAFYPDSVLDSPSYRRLVAGRTRFPAAIPRSRRPNPHFFEVVPPEKLDAPIRDMPPELILRLNLDNNVFHVKHYLRQLAWRPEFDRAFLRQLFPRLKPTHIGQWVLRREFFDLLPSREMRAQASLYILALGTPENKIVPVGEEYTARKEMRDYVGGRARFLSLSDVAYHV